MENLKLHKRSDLDTYEMDNRTFDDKKDAWRVTMVDGVSINVDNITLPELKLPEQKTIEVPVIIKEQEIHQINVPVFIKEYEKVEVPIIIKEVEYKVIEVPVIVPEIRIIEIEKPVIIKEIIYKELPTIMKVCIMIQAIASVGILLTHFILKG